MLQRAYPFISATAPRGGFSRRSRRASRTASGRGRKCYSRTLHAILHLKRWFESALPALPAPPAPRAFARSQCRDPAAAAATNGRARGRGVAREGGCANPALSTLIDCAPPAVGELHVFPVFLLVVCFVTRMASLSSRKGRFAVVRITATAPVTRVATRSAIYYTKL